jgi:hypothetical protein
MKARAGVEGHWMVSALGDSSRYQHFVPIGAEPWRDAGGWPMGWHGRCGRRAMTASAEYRAGIPVCPDCAALVPHPVEHGC